MYIYVAHQSRVNPHCQQENDEEPFPLIHDIERRTLNMTFIPYFLYTFLPSANRNVSLAHKRVCTQETMSIVISCASSPAQDFTSIVNPYHLNPFHA